METDKCKTCGMDTDGFKCADCGNERAEYEKKTCDCPPEREMPKCSQCRETEESCNCPASFL